MFKAQMKFGCINFKKYLMLSILFLSIEAANAKQNSDLSIPFDEKILTNAFTLKTGEIYGLKNSSMLFFFRVKSKEGCISNLINTAINIKTCEITIPTRNFSYEHDHCFDTSPENFFDAKAFYYQFYKYPEYHKLDNRFYRFTNSSPEILRCLRLR